jgi:glycerol-3-phosphate acyltransferase PlsY
VIFNIVVAIVIGYLLGSIPFAYIVARLKNGVDIRQAGGGNAGALNTWREVGPVYGLVVLIADIAKGALAILIARWLGLSPVWTGVVGFAAVAGHNWPCFLGFRGGKGAATVIGVLLPLAPLEWVISLGIWIVLLIITHNVRFSLVGLVFIPLGAWLFDKSLFNIVYPLALLLFLVVRTLVDLKGEMARTGGKTNLIVDRDYHFWQTKKAK